MERGRIEGLPKFFEFSLLSQERIKLRTSNFVCTFLVSIDRNKSPLQISGKVAGGVCEDSRNFSGHPYIGRIARSSLRYQGFLVLNSEKNEKYVFSNTVPLYQIAHVGRQ